MHPNGELTFTQSKRAAAVINTAVQAVCEDSYRSPKKLKMMVSHAEVQPGIAGPVEYFRRLIQFIYIHDDFEPIDAYLKYCHAEFDYSESAEKGASLPDDQEEFFNELVTEYIADGSIRSHATPQPDVERWVKDTADKILDLLFSTEGLQQTEGRHLARAIIGTQVLLHNLHFPIDQFWRNPDQANFNLVASHVHDIRNAVLCTILREVPPSEFDEEKQEPLFFKELQDYASHTFRSFDFALQGQDYIRPILTHLQRDQEDMNGIINDMKYVTLLPEVAAFLEKNCRDFLQEAPRHERVMPWGQCTFIHPLQPDSHLYYNVDGLYGISRVGVTWVRGDEMEDEMETILPKLSAYATIKNVWMCNIDALGKLFFSKRDRLAPPVPYDDFDTNSDTIRRADRWMNHQLFCESKAHPELFYRLQEIGPVFIVQRQEGRVILCRSEAAPDIAEMLQASADSPEKTAELLNDVALSSEQSWSSFPLRSSEEKELPPTEENVQKKSISQHNLLRMYCGQRYMWPLKLAQEALHAAHVVIQKPLHGGSHAMAMGPRGRFTFSPQGLANREIYGSYLCDIIQEVGDVEEFSHWVRAQKEMRKKIQKLGSV